MINIKLLLILPLALCIRAAMGADCTPVRVGYTDQSRPPWFLGAGTTVARPAGVVVDLIEKSFDDFECGVMLKRLPPARLVTALNMAQLDFAMLPITDDLASRLVFPAGAGGQLDRQRALHMLAVVFVRARNREARQTEPLEYFQKHPLGVVKEAYLFKNPALNMLTLDFGATDIWSNLEKLSHGRVEGAMVGLPDSSSLDDMVTARYGDSIVRLPAPLTSIDFTLATNAEFYRRNRTLVERTWNRIRDRWPRQLSDMLRKEGAAAENRPRIP